MRPVAALLGLVLLLLSLPATSAAAPRQAESGEAAPEWVVRAATLQRLGRDPRLFQFGPDGSVEAIFGVPRVESAMVFYPVTRTWPLPTGHVPSELTYEFRHPLRAIMASDLRAMLAAGERAGAYIAVVSGYRSYESQAILFEGAVARQLARDPTLERAEAETLASRFVAAPGHSQHQLGTTADLSTWEIGYSIQQGFAETRAGRWLFEHAWEYGFVFPYTEASEPRTGYIPEPWHVRWVGRPLAALLWEQDYFSSSNPTVDDVLIVLEEILTDYR